MWSSVTLSNIKSPKTGKNEQNEAASRQSAVAVNFWKSSSTPHWAHDSSLEISLRLVIIWLINKFMWPTKLGEILIFPRSLQRWINSPEATVFLTFLQNHDTCVKSEGYFSSLACFGQKCLSVFQNSSFIALKHYLSETYPDVKQGICRNEAKWRG